MTNTPNTTVLMDQRTLILLIPDEVLDGKPVEKLAEGFVEMLNDPRGRRPDIKGEFVLLDVEGNEGAYHEAVDRVVNHAAATLRVPCVVVDKKLGIIELQPTDFDGKQALLRRHVRLARVIDHVNKGPAS